MLSICGIRWLHSHIFLVSREFAQAICLKPDKSHPNATFMIVILESDFYIYIYNSYWDKVEAPNTIAKLDDESDNYRIFGRYNYGFYGVYTEFTSFFTVNFAPPSSLGLRYSHRPNLLSSFTEAAENWLRRPISTTGKKYSIYWIAGIGKCPILGILDITL